MAMLVAAGFVGGAGLVTRWVRYRGCRGRCITIQRARIRRHRQLLEQQAEQRDERNPAATTMMMKHHTRDREKLDLGPEVRPSAYAEGQGRAS